MGLFDKFLRKTNTVSFNQESEQAVIISFRYEIDGLERLHRLEKELEKVIELAGVGEYDGHEIATDYSDGFLYMYGSNAETLFKTIQPTLKKSDFMRDAIAKLRFADGIKEILVKLNE